MDLRSSNETTALQSVSDKSAEEKETAEHSGVIFIKQGLASQIVDRYWFLSV